MQSKNLYNPIDIGDYCDMTIRREIDGYVFTDTILRCLCFSLFSIVYGRSSSTYPVICVEGLLGTGKSYFLKYLSFCLHPQYQGLAMDRLIEAVRRLNFDSSMELPPVTELVMLKKKIQESDYMLFCDNYAHNLYTDFSLNAYFWRAFNKMEGYSSYSIALAEYLEAPLDEKGVLDAWHKRTRDYGIDISTCLGSISLVSRRLDLGLELAKELAPDLPYAEIRDHLIAGDPEIKAEAFAKKLAAYFDGEEKNLRIVFFVDNLLYFLHHDEKHVLSFHQLIERLSTYCNQRVWLVTSSFPSLELEEVDVKPSYLTKILDKCTRVFIPGRTPDPAIEQQI